MAELFATLTGVVVAGGLVMSAALAGRRRRLSRGDAQVLVSVAPTTHVGLDGCWRVALDRGEAAGTSSPASIVLSTDLAASATTARGGGCRCARLGRSQGAGAFQD